MADLFQRAETVICSILVKNSADTLTDPATSMVIEITDPEGRYVVAAATAMTKDTTGTYHYDYTPASNAVLGVYRIRYTATDGTRVSIGLDDFVLEYGHGTV